MESQWSVFYPDNYANPAIDTDETLYMRIKRACTRYPDRVALEYGARKILYSTLLSMIDEVAVSWKKLGVQKGDVVMIIMGNNPINILSVYALDKIGASAAISVPNLSTEYFAGYANCVNAKYCVMSCNQYLNYSSVLKETSIKTVIIGKYRETSVGITKVKILLYPLASYDTPKPKNVPEGITLKYWKDAFQLNNNSASHEISPHDRDNKRTVLYLFPSLPSECKAAEFNARSLNVSADTAEMVLKANEDLTGKPARMLCLNETCFSFGFSFGIHNLLSCGQTALLFTWYNADKIFFAIRKYKPDVLIGYTSTVASINKAGWPSDILKSVDRIIVGGGLLTSSQKATLFEIARSSGKKLSVCSITGCDDLLAYAYGPSDLQSDRLLGFPLPGIIMRIADPDTGLDVPEGAEGEIIVCSPISRFYGSAEELTATPKYRKLPDGRIWYFTGNVGKQDGNKMFYLVASNKRAVTIGSYPVYPSQVDETVQMTEGVTEACTVIIDRAEGSVLVAAVVPAEEYFFDNSLMEDLRDRIRSECELTLHESMRPSEIAFFVSLPRNSKGEIDYEAVKEKVEMLQIDVNMDENLTETPPAD